MSVSVKARAPPLPPPKPRAYFVQASTNNDLSSHCRSTNIQSKKLGLAQVDSDTDSGICGDSDNQPSPGRNRFSDQEFFNGDQNCNIFSTNFASKHAKCSTVTSSRRDAYKPNLTTSEAQVLRQRRLPAVGPVLNGNTSTNCRLNRSGKNFRVRFADQVIPAAEPSVYASDEQDSRLISTCFNDRLPISADTFDKNLLEAKRHLFDAAHNCSESVNVMLLDNNDDSLPPPPNYGKYFGTLKGTETTRYSRQQAPAHNARYYPNRSSSLPRAVYEPRSDDRWICADFTKQPINIEFTIQQPDHMSGTLVRNTNHVISDTQSNFRPNGGRLLPDAPVNLTSNRSRIRQPAFSRQRRVKQAQIQHRSHSVGPSNWKNYDDRSETLNIVPHRETTPAIRAKLVALDHRGFRTVVIEKMNPGPFGFYIATGVINQRRGIFISRVSLPSLMPVLSVGDELIYVENELIKGRTLEYVQSLIAGKNVVTILLLPNTSSALC